MAKKMIDINCDMGESFGLWQLGQNKDEDIMKLITSANIAAGFHAGDPNYMLQTVGLAIENNVGVGVHPGYNDLQGFGRRYIKMSDEELINDIVYQVGALSAFVRIQGGTLSHIKPHGALYMELAKNESLSAAYIKAMKQLAPEAPVLCLYGTKTYQAAKDANHPVVCEFYADRDYNDEGNIVFTRTSAKLDSALVAQKVLKACQTGYVTTVTGNEIEVNFDSVCFHSDAPDCIENIQQTRSLLLNNGIELSGMQKIINQPTKMEI